MFQWLRTSSLRFYISGLAHCMSRVVNKVRSSQKQEHNFLNVMCTVS